MSRISYRPLFLTLALFVGVSHTASLVSAQKAPTGAYKLTRAAYALMFGQERAARFFAAPSTAVAKASALTHGCDKSPTEPSTTVVHVKFESYDVKGYGLIRAYDAETNAHLGRVEYELRSGNPPYMLMDDLEVEKAHYKRGIGRQLFYKVHAQAIEKKVNAILWTAKPFNLPQGISNPEGFRQLHLFYTKLGGKLLDGQQITAHTESAEMIYVMHTHAKKHTN